MKRVRVKETEDAIYITALFEEKGVPHQASFSLYDGYLHCEVVPSSAAARGFMEVLRNTLGNPEDGPRVRESYSDCGEEPGSLFASWKGNATRESWKEAVLSALKKEGFEI